MNDLFHNLNIGEGITWFRSWWRGRPGGIAESGIILLAYNKENVTEHGEQPREWVSRGLLAHPFSLGT
jgi:hypothetical protein